MSEPTGAKLFKAVPMWARVLALGVCCGVIGFGFYAVGSSSGYSHEEIVTKACQTYLSGQTGFVTFESDPMVLSDGSRFAVTGRVRTSDPSIHGYHCDVALDGDRGIVHTAAFGE